MKFVSSTPPLVSGIFFTPRNAKVFKNYVFRRKLARVKKKCFYRFSRLNASILDTHVNGLLYVLIGTFRRLTYGRHLYLCYSLANLFLSTNNFVFGQALIRKISGFDFLRLFFSKNKVVSFLLSKKDLRYLRMYNFKFENFEGLFSGGYNFFVYAPNTSLVSIRNFFGLLTFRSLELVDDTIKFVRFYPLMYRLASLIFYKDFFYSIMRRWQSLVKLGFLSEFDKSRMNLCDLGSVNYLPYWVQESVITVFNAQLFLKLKFFLSEFKEKCISKP